MDEGKPLPTNWRMARDSDGKPYYFNELTGETSWNFPEVPVETTPEMPTATDPDMLSGPSMVEVMPQGGDGPMSLGETTTREPRPSIGAQTRRELLEVFGDGLPKLLLLLIASFVLIVQVRPTRVPSGFRLAMSHCAPVSVPCPTLRNTVSIPRASDAITAALRSSLPCDHRCPAITAALRSPLPCASRRSSTPVKPQATARFYMRWR